MISRFFIDRPVFAIVLSLVFVLAGGVAVFTLPVAQYPEVTPPTVLVTAIYPGANAVTVRNTVAAPIEEQVSGVEGMMYMSSKSTNDGTYSLTVTFRLGMDSDMAQVLVQNRVSLALPVIPALVQNEGITVKKMSPNTMMIVNLISPDGRYDSNFLSNYATIYIKDELGRLPGVSWWRPCFFFFSVALLRSVAYCLLRPGIRTAKYFRHPIDQLAVMLAIPWFVEMKFFVECNFFQIRQHRHAPTQQRLAILIAKCPIGHLLVCAFVVEYCQANLFQISLRSITVCFCHSLGKYFLYERPEIGRCFFIQRKH